MDVFGGTHESTTSRGKRGKKGPRGDPGTSGLIDIYNWLPYSVLEIFQVDTEECCFIIRKKG